LSHKCAECKSKNLSLERRIQTVAEECARAVSTKEELNETLRNTNNGMAKLRKSLIAKDEHIELLGKEAAQMEHKLKTEIKAMNADLVEEQGRTKLLERRCFKTQKLEIGQQTL